MKTKIYFILVMLIAQGAYINVKAWSWDPGVIGVVGSTSICYLTEVTFTKTGWTKGENDGNCLPWNMDLIKIIDNVGEGEGWQYSTDQVNWINLPVSNLKGTIPGTGKVYVRFWMKRKFNLINACTSVSWIETPTKYSNVLSLNIYPERSGGSIGSNQTICYNTQPSKILNTVYAGGGSGTITYSWESSTDKGNTWNTISGANLSYYEPGILTKITYYRRKSVDAVCQVVLYSTQNVVINVSDELKGGSVTSNQTICYNTKASMFTLKDDKGGYNNTRTYKWQYSVNSGSSWTTTSGTSNTFTDGSNLTRTTWYRVEVNGGSCGTVYSSNAVVTVRSSVNPGTIGSNQNIFYNTTPAQLTNVSSPSGGDGSYVYRWDKKGKSESSWTTGVGTSSTYQPTALIEDTEYRRYADDQLCGNGSSNTIKVTVYGEVNPGVAAQDQVVCNGALPAQILGTSASGGSGSYEYQWQYSVNSTSWSAAINGTTKDYQPITLAQATWYRRRVNCVGQTTYFYTNTIYIDVKNTLNPGAIQSNQTICYGSAPVTLVGNNATGGKGEITYMWERSINGADWTPDVFATDINYSPGPLTQKTYFRRAATNDCGTQYTNVVTISVYNPIVPGDIAGNQSICFDAKPTMIVGEDPTGGDNLFTYQWYQSYDGEYWDKIVTASAASYSASKLKATTYFKREVISQACGASLSNAVTIEVMDSMYGGSVAENQRICYNSIPMQMSGDQATGGDNSFLYQWQKSENGTSWSDIALKTEQNLTESVGLTKLTYYRRKATSLECGDALSNIITIDVVPNLLAPQIDLEDQYCKNSTVELKIKDKKENLQYYYVIQQGDTSNSSEITLERIAKDSVIKVMSSYENLCYSPMAEYTIEVDPVKADFKVTSTNVQPGDEIKFTNLSSNYKSCEWNFNGENVSYRENPWCYFYNDGLKKVTLIAKSSACADTLIRENYILVGTVSGERQVRSDNDIRVFPIPFIDKISIEITNGEIIENVKVFSITGELIENIEANGNTIVILTSDFQKGVYFLQIQGKNGILVKKIQKI